MAGKERPILFSGEMVRAILDGRKTQTRRIAKLDLSPWLDGQADKIDESEMVFQFSEGHSGFGLYVSCADYPEEGSDFYKCPYGKPGDRLWVRETFFVNHWDYCNGEKLPIKPSIRLKNSLLKQSDYRADGLPNYEGEENEIKWRPSIHMPRWASRITLEITNVRVERMQDGGDREFWGEEKWNKNPWVWVIEFKKVEE